METNEDPPPVPLPWHYRHTEETGHTTFVSLTEPGRCLDCDERSPAYGLLKRIVRRGD